MAFVIGVAGQQQMGKDTLADYLAKRLNERGGKWARTAFASNVKKVYCDTFDRDLDFVEEWKTKNENPPGFGQTVRQSLQFIGDGFRQIKGSIWLDLTFRNKEHQIISDVRYVNEFERVKAEGGLNILIGRTEKLNNDQNGSEAQIRPYIEWALNNLEDERVNQFKISQFIQKPPQNMDQFDLFIRNDGTKEELYDKVDKLVVPFVDQFDFNNEVK